jgi:hypothetical protein
MSKKTSEGRLERQCGGCFTWTRNASDELLPPPGSIPEPAAQNGQPGREARLLFPLRLQASIGLIRESFDSDFCWMYNRAFRSNVCLLQTPPNC